MSEFYNQVTERLIRYASIGTQSSDEIKTYPTTQCQFDLARVLYEEMKTIGMDEVWLDEKNCIVYGKLYSNLPEGEIAQGLGLIAHMDTAPGTPGAPVHPWVLENYQGGDIVLNAKKQIVMREADFSGLGKYIGQDLVLTDGTTLLGGDDKAAVAAMMTMAEYLAGHPERKHGLISFAFTPDEEVGGLAKDLDLKCFGTETAYTLDGDHLGYYIDETFNASEAVIEIQGLSVHPATAKGIMKNAVDISNEFLSMLPPLEKPQYTSGREGFYYVHDLNANCEKSVIKMIIRDHSRTQFEIREEYLRKCQELLNQKYGAGTVALSIEQSYRNMKEIIDQVPYMTERLKQAIADCGIEPVCEPFRGGTDGSALSWRGLPCPNLSAGYENAHGRFEYVPIQSMEKNVEILLRLAELFVMGNVEERQE